MNPDFSYTKHNDLKIVRDGVSSIPLKLSSFRFENEPKGFILLAFIMLY